MIDIKYFIHRLQDVKLRDVIQVFPMLLALLLILFNKKKYEDVWLICEEPKEARDNGYWFFKFMTENHPEQRCIYAIDKKSVDYLNVKNLGEVIQYGSVKHWIVYFCAKHTISSQKGGKPNAALCAFIELNGLYNSHMIFLQHGITINNVRWLYADRSKIDLFITAAIPEYKYILNNFGYSHDRVVLTGFSRFDGLHEFVVKKNRILIMPTWRSWFTEKSSMQGELNEDFLNSTYLSGWKKFLEHPKLKTMIEEKDLEVIFFPHRNMQFLIDEFIDNIDTKVTIASWKEYDIQDLMKSSQMMVTDYSSVFFDMVYMKKPVVFYQFDIEDFRKAHYSEGYFNYFDNPFGKSYLTPEDALERVEYYVNNDFKIDVASEEAHKSFFKYYDSFNSKRIFEMIQKADKKL